MKRLVKEYEINGCKHFTIKMGTTNRECPKTFYITSKTWITPSEEFEYANEINDAVKTFKYNLRKSLMALNVPSKNIFECSINTNAMEKNISSFLSISIVLLQNNYNNMKDIKEFYNETIINLFDSFHNDLRKRKFTLSKKRH